MAERKNPLDLSGFTPRAPSLGDRRPAPEVIDAIAESTGFPSRQPASSPATRGHSKQSDSGTAPRSPAKHKPDVVSQPLHDNRRRTGRNVQRNIKMTAQAMSDLDEEALLLRETFGEVLERGIAAIRRLREMGIDDYFQK